MPAGNFRSIFLQQVSCQAPASRAAAAVVSPARRAAAAVVPPPRRRCVGYHAALRVCLLVVNLVSLESAGARTPTTCRRRADAAVM